MRKREKYLTYAQKLGECECQTLKEKIKLTIYHIERNVKTKFTWHKVAPECGKDR